jgi:hypothetical protein
MRAPTATLIAAAWSLAGCCAGGYPLSSGASPAPFDAFNASMRLAVGMPTNVAILAIGSAPVSAETKSCGVAAGYAWTCQIMKFGCCENNQLLVYIAETPDGLGAVNSWTLRKG